MKYLVIPILISVCLLSSCDNRNEFLKNINTAPTLVFEDTSLTNEVSNKTIEKKVKVYKNSPGKVTVRIKPFDNEKNITSITYQVVDGSGISIVDSSIFKSYLADIKSGKNVEFLDIQLAVSSLGTSLIRFTIVDLYKRTDFVELKINSFDNYEPKANLEITPIKLNSPLEYEFDASSSYDSDLIYGGGIKVYNFIVNDVNILSDKPKIKYVFPKRGNYQIKLKVLDTDNVWSKEAVILESI